MNNQMMLDFLMEHNIVLLCELNGRTMSADGMYKLEGEFTVYQGNSLPELYRGDSFDNAVYVMEGKND